MFIQRIGGESEGSRVFGRTGNRWGIVFELILKKWTGAGT
jgi:hypothetical protein